MSMKFRGAFLFSTLFLSFLAIGGTTGCSTLNSGPTPRKFVIEKDWVRSTLDREFLGFRRMNRMPPLLTERLVIQANAIDGIVAYDRRSGIERWKLRLENGVEGGADHANGRLYFGSSDGQFYCVDAANGRVLWTFPVRAETLAQPTVENGVVYFQSGTDVVFALDAQTGKQLWLYNRQTTTTLSIRASTRPVVDGESVLVGFSDGYLVSLRKKDGGMEWERKLSRNNRFRDIDATPVVSGDQIFVSSFDGALHSLRRGTGEVLWQVEGGGFTAATVMGEQVYYGTSTGQVLSLDKTSGKTLWTVSLEKGIATQPVFHKGYLVYGESEGALVVADARSGQTVNRFEPGRGLVSRPTVVDESGEVYFISNNANLYALKIGWKRAADYLPWQTL